MRKKVLFFCLFLCNVLFGYEDYPKEFPRVLMLVTTCDIAPVFVKLQQIWKQYMHSDPDHIKVYFVRGDANLLQDYEIKKDDILVKTAESVIPGLINKTLLSLEGMLSNLHNFDYIVWTNLSSFWVFPNLLDFVTSLPKEGCYCAIEGKWQGFSFGSGAGYIYTPDVARLILSQKDIFYKHSYLSDDVLMGRFLLSHGYKLLPSRRIDILTLGDWDAIKDSIPNDAFHFRVKNQNNQRREINDIYIHEQLLEKYYLGN